MKDILRAVAVMHIEIEYRDALQAVLLQRVSRPHRDVVEDAEPHRLPAFRVMSGRADTAKGILDLARHHQIHRHDHRSRRT